MVANTPSNGVDHGRRRFVALVTTSIAAAGAASILSTKLAAAAGDDAIRPFRVNIPEEQLVDLRRRLNVTRWPDRETIQDQSQGVQLAKLQELVRYWGAEYDWQKLETRLNALPQFVTTIDGLDIHFIHVRSRHPNALPVIMTHGWPGSIIEQLTIIDRLPIQPRMGGRRGRFRCRVPILAGLWLLRQTTGTGWDPDRIARAWAILMKRLGYARYVAQGGDWGAPISSAMARQNAPDSLGIHINLPATVPPEVAALLAGTAAPAVVRKRTCSAGSSQGKREERQRSIFHDDDRAAADGRLWRDGFAGGPCGVDSRSPGLRAVDIRRGSRAISDDGSMSWTTFRCTG